MNAHLPIDNECERATIHSPDCDCADNPDLCDEHRNMLINFGKLEADMRSLSHAVAGVLGSHGQEMSTVARGKLRAAFTEFSLPHLPDWSAEFWERMANMIQEDLAGEGPVNRARQVAEDIAAKGWADVEGEMRR